MLEIETQDWKCFKCDYSGGVTTLGKTQIQIANEIITQHNSKSDCRALGAILSKEAKPKTPDVIMNSNVKILVYDIGGGAGTLEIESDKAFLSLNSGSPFDWVLFEARQMAIVIGCSVFIDDKPDDGRVIVVATRKDKIAQIKVLPKVRNLAEDLEFAKRHTE